jgi:hypothetical protein
VESLLAGQMANLRNWVILIALAVVGYVVLFMVGKVSS